MQWDDLKYVLATARTGRFLTAAALLQVTHTTVGRRVRALERDLGRPLFHRSREGCRPTQLCLDLLPRAEAMEAEVRRIALIDTEIDEAPEGPIRLHTAAWLLRRVLIPELPALKARFPALRPFFVGDVVDTISDPRVPGVALRFDVLPRRTEIERDLCDIPFSLYARSDLDPAALPFVSSAGGPVRMQTTGWLDRQGVGQDSLAALANDADLVHAAIGSGAGKGLITEALGEADPALVRVNRGKPELVRRLRAILPRGQVEAGEVQALLGWVEACLSHHFAPATPVGHRP